MADIYYLAAWTDSGCILGCDHKHLTVLSAVACISSAGGYVVAVENGTLRPLTSREEQEFQFAMYGTEIVRGSLRPLRPSGWTKPILN